MTTVRSASGHGGVPSTSRLTPRAKSVGAAKAKASPKATAASLAASPKAAASQRSGRAASASAKPSASAVAVQEEPVLVLDRQTENALRESMVASLASIDVFNPEDQRSYHGRAFSLVNNDAAPPRVTWKSDKKPRQNSPDWLTASEYQDQPDVLAAKVGLLAALLKMSYYTLAYTGAGLSVAAGIGMAAVGSSTLDGMGVAGAGEPTLSHCVMAELNRQNLMHGWVQQNHDGLPQKAGYRQENINEIHGSWFDPSNPVVKYSGTLRGDLHEDLCTQAVTADLVVVLGTSLTGLNADQCVTETAARSRCGEALGSVIISPQRTAQDGRCALRIFAKSDEVMRLLSVEMGFGPRAVGKGRGIKCSADLFPKVDRVLVPYDKHGCRSTTVKTHWDLSRGQKLRISEHNNLDGAKQPQDKNLTPKTVGTSNGRDVRTCSFHLNMGGVTKKLGLWWLETAMRGGLEYLPVVNVDAKEIPADSY